MSSSSVKFEVSFLRLFDDVCWRTSWWWVNIRFSFGVDSSDGSNEFVDDEETRPIAWHLIWLIDCSLDDKDKSDWLDSVDDNWAEEDEDEKEEENDSSRTIDLKRDF